MWKDTSGTIVLIPGMKNGLTQFAGWLAMAWLGTAQAQLPDLDLPPLQTPRVQTDPLLREVGATVTRLPGRTVRIEQLVARHRPELDRDTRGELVVRAEVVALDISDAALRAALDKRFQVARTQELPDLAVKVTVLRTPEGMSANRGLKVLRKLDPAGVYDFNHVYLDAGADTVGGAVATAVETAAAARAPSTGAAPRRVGLIDGGVDTRHAALQKATVHPFGCNGEFFPDVHGTGVASVMLARDAALELYAADVYCGRSTGGAIDGVAAAFGWLAREKIAVINVSLVGPRNALLERVVATLVQRGHAIVAAVGNDGPAAAPLFPAAYDGVVGVTAVDAKHKVIVEACRGPHVDFAARGADLSGATQPPDAWGPVRGTSFAAPRVAVLFAERLAAPDVTQREQTIAALTGVAVDLGKSGRDDVYGAGEIGGQ
jgi:hypothetical protein